MMEPFGEIIQPLIKKMSSDEELGTLHIPLMAATNICVTTFLIVVDVVTTNI